MAAAQVARKENHDKSRGKGEVRGRRARPRLARPAEGRAQIDLAVRRRRNRRTRLRLHGRRHRAEFLRHLGGGWVPLPDIGSAKLKIGSAKLENGTDDETQKHTKKKEARNGKTQVQET